jgi:hypothetical protein
VVDALRDVGRLLVDGVDDRAGVVIEAELGVRVPDPLDRLAGDLLDVHVGRGRDLPGDDHKSRVHQRLARHPARRIVAHDRVEDPVGDLVGDLVGMPLGDGFGGEQVLVVR